MPESDKDKVRDAAGYYRTTGTCFGTRLRRCRESRNMSLARLADHSGIAAVTLEEMEKSSSTPGLRMLERLCSALDIPLEKLLG